MADIRTVTDDFSVAPQIATADLPAIAAQGFKLVINNRPDGEAPGQPSSEAIAEAAKAAGLDYVHIPVRGGPTREQVEAMHTAVQGAGGAVLAFCRSGTRSITSWAVGQAMHEDRPREALVRLGQEAGYDLSGALG